jgi:DivIVA domain-containing protein
VVDARSLRTESFESRWWGYSIGEVDTFLENVAVAIDTGQPLAPFFTEIAFCRSARGYRVAQVDRYLDRIVSESCDLSPASVEETSSVEPEHTGLDHAGFDRGEPEQEELKFRSQGATVSPVGDHASASPSKKAARKRQRLEMRLAMLTRFFAEESEFLALPGKHLTWRKAGRGGWELVTDSSGAVSVSVTKRDLVISQGRTYAWRKAGNQKFWDANPNEELVNTATNAPLLRKSGSHWDHKGDTRMALIGHQELQFPVRDLGSFGHMSAIDQCGNILVEYRMVRSKHQSRFQYRAVEAVISPETLTIPNIELLVAVSAPLLISYGESSGGG